jgi:hypothetical protein
MKNVYIIIFSSLFLLSCEKNISEFQQQNFIKLFGTGISTSGFGVQELADGYILVGLDNTALLNNQVFIVRTSKSGNMVWQKQYGTILNDKGIGVKAVDNTFFVAGNSTNLSSEKTNSFILRLDSNGDELGSFVIESESNSIVIHDFIVDSEAIYVAGETYQLTDTESDYFIAKYTYTGVEIWNVPFSASGAQKFKKIFKSDSNKLLLIGTTSVVPASSFTHITIAELSNSQGVPIRTITLPTQSNHLFGDAHIHQNELLIAYNHSVGTGYSATIASFNLSTLQSLWISDSELPFFAKGITKSDKGTITVCGEKGDNVHVSQLNSSGIVTQLSGNLKLPTGTVEGIINTKDNGFALIGTTAPDYGIMMQLLKSDAGLFLFNQ